MEPRDDRWDVDFVVGDEDAAEEVLVEPARRPPYRNPLFVAAAAVVLALTVVGGFRLAAGSPGKPSAVSSKPSEPSVHAPVFPAPQLREREVPPVPGLREAAADTLPAGLRYCPLAGDGESACSSSRRLSHSVPAALHAHLPTARDIRGYEEQLRDVGFGSGGLWYRQVHARLRFVTVTITVARQRIPQPEEVMKLPQFVGFSFHRAGFFVRTLVYVHGSHAVPILRLMALTRDPRLRVVA